MEELNYDDKVKTFETDDKLDTCRVRVSVSTEKETVALEFSKPVSSLVLSKPAAVELSRVLRSAIRKLGTDKDQNSTRKQFETKFKVVNHATK